MITFTRTETIMIDLHLEESEAVKVLDFLSDVEQGPLYQVKRALFEALTGEVLPLKDN